MASASIDLRCDGSVARVVLHHPARLNAMTRAMWRALRSTFLQLHTRADLRCVIVQGAGGHFCAGGDIAEYPAFRFQPASLRAFHEEDVWGGLAAMLACDLPIVAAIEGNCMGAGMEIASCCDLRVAARDARFGAPIARLGFPMAPREAQLVARVAGEATAREMLLEAAVLDAPEMKSRGFVHALAEPADVLPQAQQRAQRIAALAPAAARAHKQLFRALNRPVVDVSAGVSAIESVVNGAYDYAGSQEHHEGIHAFLQKRSPRFADPDLNPDAC